MEPEEYAEELYCKYDSLFKAPFKKHQQIKDCALIAVDEILSYVDSLDYDTIEFLTEVKKEIQKL
jgi:hypothetical protein